MISYDYSAHSAKMEVLYEPKTGCGTVTFVWGDDNSTTVDLYYYSHVTSAGGWVSIPVPERMSSISPHQVALYDRRTKGAIDTPLRLDRILARKVWEKMLENGWVHMPAEDISVKVNGEHPDAAALREILHEKFSGR